MVHWNTLKSQQIVLLYWRVEPPCVFKLTYQIIVSITYLKPYNCLQTNDYYQIEVVTWNTIVSCKWVRLATIVEGKRKALFSVATTLPSLDCSTLFLIRTLYCWVSSKEVSSTIFKVFGTIRPRLPDHWRTPYSLGKWAGEHYNCI